MQFYVCIGKTNRHYILILVLPSFFVFFFTFEKVKLALYPLNVALLMYIFLEGQ